METGHGLKSLIRQTGEAQTGEARYSLVKLYILGFVYHNYSQETYNR